MSNDLTIQRAYVELSVIEGELSILVDRIRKVMYRLRHGHDGNEPSPAKPRTRRQFNEDMQRLHDDLPSMVEDYLKNPRVTVERPTGPGFMLADRERQDREATRPQRLKMKHYASLVDLVEALLSDEGLSENSSPATAASGPRKARPATRARKATSSNAAKPVKRRKGGK